MRNRVLNPLNRCAPVCFLKGIQMAAVTLDCLGRQTFHGSGLCAKFVESIAKGKVKHLRDCGGSMATTALRQPITTQKSVRAIPFARPTL